MEEEKTDKKVDSEDVGTPSEELDQSEIPESSEVPEVSEVDMEPVIERLEKLPTVEDSEKQFEPVVKSLEEISYLMEQQQESSNTNEIDLQPIIERLDKLENIQVEFFNSISVIILLIPTVFIAVFAIKEFMDRAVKW